MGADGNIGYLGTLGASGFDEYQRTLKNPIHCAGVGVHSGERVHMTLRPAPAGHGIVFHRTDIGESAPALWDHAVESPLCTTLVTPSGARIATIEHLMSALLGLGIDNLLVELDGPEVPIMDGSAAPFVFLIECAGQEQQDRPRRRIEVLKRVEVTEPHRSAALVPDAEFGVGFVIDFPNALIQRQAWQGAIRPAAYKREIARARTFGRAVTCETRARVLGRMLPGRSPAVGPQVVLFSAVCHRRFVEGVFSMISLTASLRAIGLAVALIASPAIFSCVALSPAIAQDETPSDKLRAVAEKIDFLMKEMAEKAEADAALAEDLAQRKANIEQAEQNVTDMIARLTQLTDNMDDNSPLSLLMSDFGKETLDLVAEAEAFAAEQQALARAGRFFFSLTHFLLANVLRDIVNR